MFFFLIDNCACVCVCFFFFKLTKIMKCSLCTKDVAILVPMCPKDASHVCCPYCLNSLIEDMNKFNPPDFIPRQHKCFKCKATCKDLASFVSTSYYQAAFPKLVQVDDSFHGSMFCYKCGFEDSDLISRALHIIGCGMYVCHCGKKSQTNGDFHDHVEGCRELSCQKCDEKGIRLSFDYNQAVEHFELHADPEPLRMEIMNRIQDEDVAQLQMVYQLLSTPQIFGQHFKCATWTNMSLPSRSSNATPSIRKRRAVLDFRESFSQA